MQSNAALQSDVWEVQLQTKAEHVPLCKSVLQVFGLCAAPCSTSFIQASKTAAAEKCCSLILLRFCLRRPLILLFWAARHYAAEMHQEHDPLCGCMATTATKERCAALGPGRIQCAVAYQYVQESLLMVGSYRPLGQVCLVLNNSWRQKNRPTMLVLLTYACKHVPRSMCYVTCLGVCIVWYHALYACSCCLLYCMQHP